METIVIFSRSAEALSDIQQRAVRLGLVPQWMPVDGWFNAQDMIVQAAGVIVDEVDPEFARRDEVMDLEYWLLFEKHAPPRMFLMPKGSRRLDGFARSNPSLTKVHHEEEPLVDEELYALTHSRPRHYADEPLVSA